MHELKIPKKSKKKEILLKKIEEIKTTLNYKTLVHTDRKAKRLTQEQIGLTIGRNKESVSFMEKANYEKLQLEGMLKLNKQLGYKMFIVRDVDEEN